MDSILIFNVIVNSDQNKELELFINNTLTSSVIVEKIAEYSLNNDDYICITLMAMGIGYTKNDMVSFLVKELDYICFRLEKTNYIFIKNFGDLADLYYDEYSRFESTSLIKDLMSIEERYELVIKSSSYIYDNNFISIIYNNEIKDLRKDSMELFNWEDEYEIMDDRTGETHLVDITIGINPKKMTIILAKDLIKTP